MLSKIYKGDKMILELSEEELDVVYRALITQGRYL
jgi:hypothetical protein